MYLFQNNNKKINQNISCFSNLSKCGGGGIKTLIIPSSFSINDHYICCTVIVNHYKYIYYPNLSTCFEYLYIILRTHLQ